MTNKEKSEINDMVNCLSQMVSRLNIIVNNETEKGIKFVKEGNFLESEKTENDLKSIKNFKDNLNDIILSMRSERLA